MGVFMAVRSAKLRRLGCGELISGMGRMRPKSVSVKPVLRVSAIWRVEIFFHAAVALEIRGDEFGGFFGVDAEFLREAERAKGRRSRRN